MIGIDNNTWLVFEGVSNYGHGVWPTPMISIATLITCDGDWGKLPPSARLDNARLIFREDSFDPVTRVRRGRLYEWRDGALNQTWFFPPHPAEPPDRNSMSMDGRLNRMLYTYHPARTFASAFPNLVRAQLVLGTQSAPTAWRIVSVETISEVTTILDKVADAAFRSSPVSLIDLCRSAATTILAHWLEASGDASDNVHHLDLGDLLKAFEKKQGNGNAQAPSATGSAIRLLQRFHSRGKPNEQKRYDTRPPTEEDAQLVLNALGFLLRELGWAR